MTTTTTTTTTTNKERTIQWRKEYNKGAKTTTDRSSIVGHTIHILHVASKFDDFLDLKIKIKIQDTGNYNNNMGKSKSSSSSNSKKRGNKTTKPPPFDEYIKPLIGLVLAFLGYHVFRGMMAKEIKRIEVAGDAAITSEHELREVLFGEHYDIIYDDTEEDTDAEEGVVSETDEDPKTMNGDNQKKSAAASLATTKKVPPPTNYAVLCYPSAALYPISSVFQDSANDGSVPNLEYRVIDCETPMTFSKEHKTIFERFEQLDAKNRPVVFVSGVMGPPKQVRVIVYSILYIYIYILFYVICYIYIEYMYSCNMYFFRDIKHVLCVLFLLFC